MADLGILRLIAFDNLRTKEALNYLFSNIPKADLALMKSEKLLGENLKQLKIFKGTLTSTGFIIPVTLDINRSWIYFDNSLVGGSKLVPNTFIYLYFDVNITTRTVKLMYNHYSYNHVGVSSKYNSFADLLNSIREARLNDIKTYETALNNANKSSKQLIYCLRLFVENVLWRNYDIFSKQKSSGLNTRIDKIQNIIEDLQEYINKAETSNDKYNMFVTLMKFYQLCYDTSIIWNKAFEEISLRDVKDYPSIKTYLFKIIGAFKKLYFNTNEDLFVSIGAKGEKSIKSGKRYTKVIEKLNILGLNPSTDSISDNEFFAKLQKEIKKNFY